VAYAAVHRGVTPHSLVWTCFECGHVQLVLCRSERDVLETIAHERRAEPAQRLRK
jgi:hypothetical protein